jgi:hypothetical protein
MGIEGAPPTTGDQGADVQGAKGAGGGRGFRELVLVLAAAAVTIVGADVALRRVAAPKYVREVQEALADYRHEDPTVLVLGSSHARTFSSVDQIARQRSGGRVRVLNVPVEWGKFRSYEWVLNERLVPFVDEGKPGPLKRPSLKHFILQTAWWDACWKDGDPPVFNLPSRAWALGHFAESVAEEGLNDHSRNYVQSRWQELFHGSILVSDRGQDRLVAGLRELALPLSPAAKTAQRKAKLESWQELMERGATCGDHPAELAAAERMLKWAQGRGYDVTLFLYPMMPITVTEKSRQEVQEPFQRSMKALAGRLGVRFVDTTFDHNLTDADFQPDFDHLTPAGHRKFSEWLVEHRLGFLLGNGATSSAGARGAREGGGAP